MLLATKKKLRVTSRTRFSIARLRYADKCTRVKLQSSSDGSVSESLIGKLQILVQFYGKALGPGRRNGEVDMAGELEIEVCLFALPGGGVGNPAPPPMFAREMLCVNLFLH